MEMQKISKMSKDIRESATLLSQQEARYLVDTYYQVQEHRIATAAQARTLSKSEEPNELISYVSQEMAVLENEIRKALHNYAISHPAGVWALDICGIGPVISAGLLAHIDISKAPTAGHIWSFAGLSNAKWEKGQKRPWNASLKTLCCHPDTLIKTIDGYKKISEIKVGELALTHKGRYRKVTQVFSNEFTENNLFGLTLRSNGMEPLLVTGYHPVYATKTKVYDIVKGDGRKSWRIKQQKDFKINKSDVADIFNLRESGEAVTSIANKYNVSVPHMSNILNGKTKILDRYEQETGWIAASEITGGYLGYSPKSINFDSNISEIIFDGEGVVCDCDGRIASQGQYCSVKAPRSIYFNPIVKLTEDVMRFIGLYIAEGHVSERTIGFSFNTSETEYIEFVRRMVLSMFGQSTHDNINDNSHQILFSNKIVANKFKEWFGLCSKTRTIPRFLIDSDINLVSSLLRGLFEGDGQIDNVVAYTTISKQLALQVYDILISMGITSKITGYTNKESANPAYRVTVNDQELFFKQVLKKDYPYHKASKNYKQEDACGAWYAFNMPDEIPYTGPVYNLDVEEDESYVANGIAVHNCWKIGQSFVKVSNNDNDVYGKIYKQRKEMELAKNEAGEYADQAAHKLETVKIGKTTDAYKWYSQGKLPPAHIQQRCERYATKIFLSHFWEIWYLLHHKALPPNPFAIGILGHAHKFNPPGIREFIISNDLGRDILAAYS